jgi:putative aldouronate transport system permease protein
VSWVVVISIFTNLLSPNGGLINEALGKLFGTEPIYFMGEKRFFLITYLLLGAWKEVGWGSIIFLAAITGIDPELYEAAELDGVGRWGTIARITIPCILPTVVIKLLLSMGGLMGVGFDQVFLMQTPTNIEVSEAINTYVVKEGIRQGHYSFATAVGLFQAVIGMFLMYISNKASKVLTETSLW